MACVANAPGGEGGGGESGEFVRPSDALWQDIEKFCNGDMSWESNNIQV